MYLIVVISKAGSFVGGGSARLRGGGEKEFMSYIFTGEK